MSVAIVAIVALEESATSLISEGPLVSGTGGCRGFGQVMIHLLHHSSVFCL